MRTRRPLLVVARDLAQGPILTDLAAFSSSASFFVLEGSMRFLRVTVVAALLAGSAASALAQAAPQESEIRASIEAATKYLDSGDYAAATTHLQAASDMANRLKLQKVAGYISSRTTSFAGDDQKFALSASSTLQFENFLKDREFAEQIYRDPNGRVVTVRVVGDPDSLKDFHFIADDPAMALKAGVELAEMRGEPALKRKGADGSLSVLMMSEKDHALIEIQGESADAVMALVEKLESQ